MTGCVLQEALALSMSPRSKGQTGHGSARRKEMY